MGVQFDTDLDAVLTHVRDMLIVRNFAYGDSALNPCRIFSKADRLEQLKVRIDDKLSRLIAGNGDRNEDTELDLIGYLILLQMARRREETTPMEMIRDAALNAPPATKRPGRPRKGARK